MSIVFAAFLFILAVGMTMIAAWFRSQAWKTLEGVIAEQPHSSSILHALPLIILACVLGTTYPWALSIGLESPTQPAGLPLFPFMVLLVSGALLGTLAMSGSRLARNRQWPMALHPPKTILILGIASGMCHFGGNIIHSIGTTALSASVAWPLGLSAALWTISWGLIQGEFYRAPRAAWIALATAIALYCVGVVIVIKTIH
ncbi:MAG: hypothetical protein QM753_05700 [Thermomicrobiales bacterium]